VDDYEPIIAPYATIGPNNEVMASINLKLLLQKGRMINKNLNKLGG
jgi:hypothetical protein